MGSITITVPQNIQVNYTVENMSLTRSLLDLLNAIMLRSSAERREDDSLLGLFADKSDLIDQVTELAMRSRETETRQPQQGVPGVNLLKFAGTLCAEDAEQMKQSIERDCRGSDINE